MRVRWMCCLLCCPGERPSAINDDEPKQLHFSIKIIAFFRVTFCCLACIQGTKDDIHRGRHGACRRAACRGKLLSPPQGKFRNAKSLAKTLDGFRREAAEKFAAELLKPSDPQLMTKIKQNLLMSMTLAQSGASADSLQEEIEEHGDALAAKYGMQDLLISIAPGLGRGNSS